MALIHREVMVSNAVSWQINRGYPSLGETHEDRFDFGRAVVQLELLAGLSESTATKMDLLIDKCTADYSA